jgi:3-oxoacyl-[acyl-carrier-protein] synthase III
VRIESLGIPRNRLTTKAESLSLASDAAADCFDHSSYERSSVDLLIFTGTYRSEFLSEPAIAALLAGELGVNADVTTPEDPTTLAFDLINGGVGFLNACHMASGLIEDGERRVALVVSSEVENNRPEGPRGLIGVAETGSAALLDVSSDGIEGFEAFRFKSFPWYQDRLVTYTEMCEGQLVVSALRDPELSRIYRECVVETVREFLESEGVAMSEIDLIIPQHVEPGFVAELARGLAVEPEKCVDLATDQNDWLSASLVHSLEHVVGSGLATRGQLALLIAVGSGLQVGCALYRF